MLILPPSMHRCAAVGAEFCALPGRGRAAHGAGLFPVYALCWQGRRVGILHSLMGGAGTVCLLEGILARGAKKVLLYGSCGALDEGIAAGRFILPTAAYRDDRRRIGIDRPPRPGTAPPP